MNAEEGNVNVYGQERRWHKFKTLPHICVDEGPQGAFSLLNVFTKSVMTKFAH